MSRTHTCAQNRVWMHTHIHTRDGHTPAHSIVCKNKVLRLRFDEEVCATLLLTPGYVQPSYSPPGMCNPPTHPRVCATRHIPGGVQASSLTPPQPPTITHATCFHSASFAPQVSPDSGKCERSQATGVLTLTLPKVETEHSNGPGTRDKSCTR